MNRRGFLALPVVAGIVSACRKVKAALPSLPRRGRVIIVGMGAGCDAPTLKEGLAMVQPGEGGVIYLMPGYHETFSSSDIDSDVSIAGEPS